MLATVSPDGGRVGRRIQAKTADFSQQLGGAQRMLGSRRFLNYGEQLPLERPMVSLRSLSKAPNDLVRGILDRKIDGHRFRTCSTSDL